MGKQVEKAVFIVCLVLMTAYAAWAVFDGLTDIDIYDLDEARHGVNAYEMAQSGDWIVNTYAGEPDYWNVKPPMSMWAIMLGYRIFGPGLLGLRFFSALSLPIIVLVMMLFLKRYIGTAAALTTGFLFATTGTRLIHLFRTGDPDALFFLFCVLAVMFLYMAYKGDARWLIGAGLGTAFAFLTKSMHVVVVFATILLALTALRKRRKFTAKELLLYLLLPMALPVLVWAGLRMSRDGVEFFRQMILLDVFNRVTTVVEGNTGKSTYYLYAMKYLLGDTILIGLFALIAAWLLLDFTNEKRPRNNWVLIAVYGGLFAVTLLIYTLATTKLSWYMYPCIIGLYTVAGYAVQRLAGWLQVRKVRVFTCVVLSVGLLLVAVGGVVAPPYHEGIMEGFAEETAEFSVFQSLEGEAVLPGYVVCRADGSPESVSLNASYFLYPIPQSWLCHALFLGTAYVPGGLQAYVTGENYVILKAESPAEQERFVADHPELQLIATSADFTGYQYMLFA